MPQRHIGEVEVQLHSLRALVAIWNLDYPAHSLVLTMTTVPQLL